MINLICLGGVKEDFRKRTTWRPKGKYSYCILHKYSTHQNYENNESVLHSESFLGVVWFLGPWESLPLVLS